MKNIDKGIKLNLYPFLECIYLIILSFYNKIDKYIGGLVDEARRSKNTKRIYKKSKRNK